MITDFRLDAQFRGMLWVMAGRGTLSEQAFFVLTALAGEPLHGYAILRVVGELSDGHVRMQVGTLYGILERLAQDDLIAPVRQETVAGRLRRYYGLTERGRQTLAEDAARQAANAAAATARLARMGLRAWGASN